MPLIITVSCFPEDVATFFAWLIPSETQPFMLGLVESIGRPLMAVLVAILGPFFLFHSIQALQALHSSRHALVVGELVALSVLFSCVPPLLSFLVYFCGWHSLRHTIALACMLSPGNPQQGIVRFVQQALPLTLVTICAAFSAWLFVQTSDGAMQAAVRIVFLTLSALTFPHMLLVALAGNRIGENYDV